jgi:hypothetical protein
MQNVKNLPMIGSREFELVVAISSLPRAEFRSAMRQIKKAPKKPTQKAQGFGRGVA